MSSLIINKHQPVSLDFKLAQYTINNIRHLTDKTFVIDVKKHQFKFKTGQRVRINLKGDTVHRKYSIYSGENDQTLQFLIREVEDGYLTPKLKPLNVNDELEVIGPNGHFGIKEEDINKRHLFISTGTGIAPFHSFVRTYTNLDYRLLHGVRTIKEAYDREHYDLNRLVVCTSKDELGDYQGRVTDYLKENQIVGQFDHIYLCGNNQMIKEAVEILKEQNYLEEQIHTEVYF